MHLSKETRRGEKRKRRTRITRTSKDLDSSPVLSILHQNVLRRHIRNNICLSSVLSQTPHRNPVRSVTVHVEDLDVGAVWLERYILVFQKKGGGRREEQSARNPDSALMKSEATYKRNHRHSARWNPES